MPDCTFTTALTPSHFQIGSSIPEFSLRICPRILIHPILEIPSKFVSHVVDAYSKNPNPNELRIFVKMCMYIMDTESIRNANMSGAQLCIYKAMKLLLQ